jgi:hypothetical protein
MATYIDESKLLTRLVEDTYDELQALDQQPLEFPKVNLKVVSAEKFEEAFSLALANPDRHLNSIGNLIKPTNLKVAPGIVALSFEVHNGELLTETGSFNLTMVCECTIQEPISHDEIYIYIAKTI